MVTIRKITADDEPEWRRLWTGYLKFYETKVEEEVYRTTFQRLLSDDHNEFHGLLAELDGKLIGLTHFLFHRHAWKVEDVCYLQDLFVDARRRGSGAGRALIEAVYRAADAAGAPDVYWLTQDFNETARKLYDQVGILTPFIRYNRV